MFKNKYNNEGEIDNKFTWFQIVSIILGPNFMLLQFY